MKRISINWSVIQTGRSLKGTVRVFSVKKEKSIGKWVIEVTHADIKAFPVEDANQLPKCYDKYHKRVEEVARAYHDGFVLKSNCALWVK